MKKILTKIPALAIGLAMLVFASCADVVDPGNGGGNPPPIIDDGTPPPVVDVTKIGLFSEEYENIEVITKTGQGSGSVTVATISDGSVAPLLGADVLKADFAHSQWGGFYYTLADGGTADSFADYVDGTVVFSLNTSGMTDFDDLEIKMASGTYPSEVGGIVKLSTLTASTTSGDWKTYRLPLKSFYSYSDGLPDLTSLTTYLGFWNPVSTSGVSTGTLLVDEVYIDKANPLTVTSVTAPAVNSAGGLTVVLEPTLVYDNGAKIMPALSAFTEWSSTNSSIVSVSNGTLTMGTSGSATITANYGELTLSVSVTVLTYGPELAINGDFSSALDADLQFLDQVLAPSAAVISNGELVITIAQAGENYQNRMVMNGYDLAGGKTYAVSFEAKAGTAGKNLRIQFGTILDGNPYYRDFLITEPSYNLTTEMVTYSFTFTAAAAADVDTQALPTTTSGRGVQDLIFATGDDDVLTTITIDNLSIKELL